MLTHPVILLSEFVYLLRVPLFPFALFIASKIAHVPLISPITFRERDTTMYSRCGYIPRQQFRNYACPITFHYFRLLSITFHYFLVGAFIDSNSALMLVGARLRHIADTKWGTRKYLSMEWLHKHELDNSPTAWGRQKKVRKILTLPWWAFAVLYSKLFSWSIFLTGCRPTLHNALKIKVS